MQGLLEFPDPELNYSCDVGSGKFEPLIHKDEAKNVTISCYNPLRENIVTCKDERLQEFIDEVDGLSLNLPLFSEVKNIPSYFPTMDIRSRNVLLEDFFVGLTLTDIISRGYKPIAGRLHEVRNIKFRTEILLSNAFAFKKNILFLTGADTLIEWVWYNREQCKLFESIKKMGFEMVGSFNFSVMEGECALAHTLNQKRSLYSAFLTEKNDLLSIPHIYALNKFHVNRWVDWLGKNPSIKVFTINCQLQKEEKEINQIITSVRSILTIFNEVHVILQGFPVNHINKFDIYLKRIHFTDKKPIKLANSNLKLLLDYSGTKLFCEYAPKEKFEDLVLSNIKNRRLYIERIKNDTLRVVDTLASM